jgi:hypothetical protein
VGQPLQCKANIFIAFKHNYIEILENT